jgi:hypothetical protein
VPPRWAWISFERTSYEHVAPLALLARSRPTAEGIKVGMEPGCMTWRGAQMFPFPSLDPSAEALLHPAHSAHRACKSYRALARHRRQQNPWDESFPFIPKQRQPAHFLRWDIGLSAAAPGLQQRLEKFGWLHSCSEVKALVSRDRQFLDFATNPLPVPAPMMVAQRTTHMEHNAAQ